MSVYTVRIPENLEKAINILITPTTSKSKIIRNALIEYVKRERFRQLRKKTLPFAEAQGILTDEDVFEKL